MGRIGPDLLKDRAQQSPFLIQHREEQVLRLNGTVLAGGRKLLGRAQRLLCLYGHLFRSDH